jgi:hypothetical protein
MKRVRLLKHLHSTLTKAFQSVCFLKENSQPFSAFQLELSTRLSPIAGFLGYGSVRA